MATTVKVTPVQVRAAKLKIKRSALSGAFVSPGVSAVANAKREAEPSKVKQPS